MKAFIMMTRKEIDEYVDEYYPDEEIMLLDDLDSAFIGLTTNNIRAVYSVQKIIDELMNQGMSEEDAYEYFSFNIECAYVGEKTPIYVNTIS
jgi:SOS response regulatory protein OraA/RecX